MRSRVTGVTQRNKLAGLEITVAAHTRWLTKSPMHGVCMTYTGMFGNGARIFSEITPLSQ